MVFLPRGEIVRLAESGTHCLIIPLDGTPISGDVSAISDVHETAASEPRQSVPTTDVAAHSTIEAIVVSASIGATVGCSIAGMLVVVTQKAPLDVSGLLHHALQFFA
jgi:hypothetical protein